MTEAEIWENRLLNSQKFRELLLETRKKLGIPLRDLKPSPIKIPWKQVKTRKKSDIIKEYIEQAHQVFLGLPHDFDLALLGYLVSNDFGKVADYDLSGCGVFMITSDMPAALDTRFGPGVYIKIPGNTLPQDMKKFIDRKTCLIKVFQDELMKKEGLSRKRKARKRNYFGRDEMIYLLGCFSKAQIEGLMKEMWGITESIGRGVSNTKYGLIARILKEHGFMVSSETVQKVLNRERKERG